MYEENTKAQQFSNKKKSIREAYPIHFFATIVQPVESGSCLLHNAHVLQKVVEGLIGEQNRLNHIKGFDVKGRGNVEGNPE